MQNYIIVFYSARALGQESNASCAGTCFFRSVPRALARVKVTISHDSSNTYTISANADAPQETAFGGRAHFRRRTLPPDASGGGLPGDNARKHGRRLCPLLRHRQLHLAFHPAGA